MFLLNSRGGFWLVSLCCLPNPSLPPSSSRALLDVGGSLSSGSPLLCFRYLMSNIYLKFLFKNIFHWWWKSLNRTPDIENCTIVCLPQCPPCLLVCISNTTPLTSPAGPHFILCFASNIWYQIWICNWNLHEVCLIMRAADWRSVMGKLCSVWEALRLPGLLMGGP